MRRLSYLFRAVLLWCLGTLLPSCIDPYMPAAISSTKSYLVVDGFINSRGVTTVNLSRTYDIGAETAPPVETGATVYVEEEGGSRYPLPEGSVKGTYRSANLTLNASKRCRLHLRTKAGKEYASEYVVVKDAPPIDNVSWRPTEDAVNIYLNSHDETNATRYYRWTYEETWEIRPTLIGELEYVNRRVQDLKQPYPPVCWQTAGSSTILLANTTPLSQDVVSEQLIRSISNTTNYLFIRYSLLVRQYAQTREEYEYWSLLKKNTENIGTLFDPLPAQLTGNVHCLTNEAELTLGYVGAGSVQEQRIFITRGQLPPTWRPRTGYESCFPPDTVDLRDVHTVFSNPANVPVSPAYYRGVLRGYTRSTPDCVDCRKRGSVVRPSFWQ